MEDKEKAETPKRSGFFKKLAKTIMWFVIGIVLLITLLLGGVVWILTPERLTPIVEQYANEFLDAQVEIGRVELTFWKTFPQLKVDVDSVTIVSDNFKELDARCAEILGRLAEMEKDDSLMPSVDVPAGEFGALLGELLADGYSGAEKRIAYSIGLHLGKWIYIADALDDLEGDEKNARYNPFLRLYGTSALSESDADGIRIALKNELIELESALDLVDFGSDPTVKNLIYNIIYLGMPKRIEEITEKFKKDNNRKDNLQND
jgi:hypothetical protein